MSFRIFKRAAWQVNDTWPDGFEPLAVPMDTCRTIDEVDTIDEAREICGDHNRSRPYRHRMISTLTPSQRRSKMLAPFYEFTEI